jgi:alpha-ketoglutaric semialdehyde dehydrogenase
MTNAVEPILVAGTWRPATASRTYRAIDPSTGDRREAEWPVSTWRDVDRAVDAAVEAATELARLPGAAPAEFLERYAARLEARAGDLVAAAHAETGLAVKPRLADIEMPRMLDQLRQAAAAAREGTWRMAMIDRAKNIRAAARGLGPVVVFPPANFPFAYGAVTGGDFAAAIAAGNPVIAKAHEGHPSVSRLAADEALAALHETGLPAATVQLLHGMEPADGERLVADSRIGGTGFTGSQVAGEKLFRAATAAGRVIWVEMGSVNPVVLLPAALAERGDGIADELTASVTGSAGQFCTKPGVVFLVGDEAGRAFIETVAGKFAAIGPQVLLGPAGCDRLVASIGGLEAAGALMRAGAAAASGPARHAPVLLEVSGRELLARPESFLVEAFGNATVIVVCESLDELARAVARVHGSLAASLYAAADGRDDGACAALVPLLVERAGRVIENRMPTGLAVVPSMQHGGPWPSAGPPFFSAVGFPWTMLRFARRVCYDGWTESRLPEIVRDAPPEGRPWRFIDHAWTRG